MNSIEKFALLFDLAVVLVVVWVARYLRRGPRPLPQQNWRPSDDARSGRRLTLFIRPKGK